MYLKLEPTLHPEAREATGVLLASHHTVLCSTMKVAWCFSGAQNRSRLSQTKAKTCSGADLEGVLHSHKVLLHVACVTLNWRHNRNHAL